MSDCTKTTCGWRENGGECSNCSVKSKYIKDGSCNCPFQMKKETFERWVKRQEENEIKEVKPCGCGGGC